MQPEACMLFPPFRLDPVNERLWRETHLLPLRAKPFTVLRYLVEVHGWFATLEARFSEHAHGVRLRRTDQHAADW